MLHRPPMLCTSIELAPCQVLEDVQPKAIVICGGAGSHSADDLGCFNLSLKGHADCIDCPTQSDPCQVLFRAETHRCIQVMEVFQPEAIVVCGGADSLSGDRLGCFNLSLEGHAGCMEFLAKFGVPLLILGGGMYSLIHAC